MGDVVACSAGELCRGAFSWDYFVGESQLKWEKMGIFRLLYSTGWSWTLENTLQGGLRLRLLCWQITVEMREKGHFLAIFLLFLGLFWWWITNESWAKGDRKSVFLYRSGLHCGWITVVVRIRREKSLPGRALVPFFSELIIRDDEVSNIYIPRVLTKSWVLVIPSSPY